MMKSENVNDFEGNTTYIKYPTWAYKYKHLPNYIFLLLWNICVEIIITHCNIHNNGEPCSRLSRFKL
jgi:hypothetical protein